MIRIEKYLDTPETKGLFQWLKSKVDPLLITCFVYCLVAAFVAAISQLAMLNPGSETFAKAVATGVFRRWAVALPAMVIGATVWMYVLGRVIAHFTPSNPEVEAIFVRAVHEALEESWLNPHRMESKDESPHTRSSTSDQGSS